MEFSKEDFGFYFSQLENGEKEKLIKNTAVEDRAVTNDVVVSVNEAQQSSENVVPENADTPLPGGKNVKAEVRLSKDDLDFDMFKPRDVPVNAEKQRNVNNYLGSMGCCCCCMIINIIIGSVLLLIEDRNREEFDQSEADRYFFIGSSFMLAALCCCLCGCTSCCFACISPCVPASESKSGKVASEPQKNFEIKLERWNNQFSKQSEALSEYKARSVGPLVADLPNWRSFIDKGNKANTERFKVVRTEVKNTAAIMMSSGATPSLLLRTIRPVCFRIDFRGDTFVSNMASFREQISAAIKLGMPGVDTVVVIVTSPGGGVTRYGLAASQLVRIKNAGLKLIVCVDSVAASGGYMMASVADEIFAAPFSMVGSIGVISVIPNVEGLLNEKRIETNILTSGRYKNTVNVVGPVTDEGRRKATEELEKIHQTFKQHIFHNRPALREHLEDVSTGEAFLAVEARKLGLVDQIKTSDEFFEEMGLTHEVINIRVKAKSEFMKSLENLTRSFSPLSKLNSLISSSADRLQLATVEKEPLLTTLDNVALV